MKKANPKPKALKNAHTSNAKFGMGDNYGSGVRNPIGKIREGMKSLSSKSLKKAPKALA